ncbi:OLC1v1001726C1 [Oldenlandia corymbosa var. corymbosa]|uniref:OLC1v1001726C1 n=1 Tax=Oldenlandia corymbosa var. corymbosa TaxID=529605 RepID=A0AAV1D9D9_OLDCO|nr:OLC1v1001726C1 [Oldenlandia corymbosa var. corymbosa]
MDQTKPPTINHNRIGREVGGGEFTDPSAVDHHHIGGGGGGADSTVTPSYEFQPIPPVGSSANITRADSVDTKNINAGGIKGKSLVLKICTASPGSMIERLKRCSIGKEGQRKLRKLVGHIKIREGFFPDWLLSEILSWLPIKLVIRCKCVSKHWHSFISNPSFPRFYMSRSCFPLSSPAPRGCPAWALVPCYMRVEGSNFLTYPHYERLEDVHSGKVSLPGCYVLPLPMSQEANARKDRMFYLVKAVSNGFVLYGLSHPAHPMSEVEHYICNPITKQWFALPPAPKYLSKEVSVGFIAQVEEECILTSYKVVLLHCPPRGRIHLELEVFSSETGEWIEYSLKSDHPVRVFGLKRAVYLNNNLHWENGRRGIIAYDPYNTPEKFRIISVPDGFKSPKSKGKVSLCDVQQGRLVLCEMEGVYEWEGFSDLKVWVLEDYSMNRWYLKHRINKENVIVDDKLLLVEEMFQVLPAAFHPYDADVIYLALNDYDIVSYNMRTRRMEAFSVQLKPEKRKGGNEMHIWPPCFLIELKLWPVCIPRSLLSSLCTYKGS